jgi:hypothetical protein
MRHWKSLTLIVTLALVAAMSLAQAGGPDRAAAAKQAIEQALAARALDLRAIMGGELLPFVVRVPEANCDPSDPDVVIHDDGVAENGYGWNASAGFARLADKFEPAAYPATISSVCFAFITNAGVASFNFEIAVYADDGAGGAPGTELGRLSAVGHPMSISGVPATPTFEQFDVSAMGLNIAAGSVYISAEWDAATAPSGVYLAADQSPTTPLNGGHLRAGTDPWTPIGNSHAEYRAMFTRAVMPLAGPGAPSVQKSFAPGQVATGGTSTLTITLRNNSQPTAAVLNADLVDTLPANVVVATPANAATTCTGTLVATPGSGTITLQSGASIPASGSCTITVDVTSGTDGTYVNTIPAGALSTQHGSNAGAATATLRVGFVFPEPYPPVTFPQGVEPITNVTFAGINNTTSPTSSVPHEDFTAIIGNVDPGHTYHISVEGNTMGAYTSYVNVFIDWNRNGVFDAGEEVQIGTIYNSTGTDGKKAETDIVVPGTALAGSTRMRVIKRWNQPAPPNNSAGYGQAEDYTLVVSDATGGPWTVTPSVGAGTGTISPDTPQTIDDGDTATFTLTPGSGYEIDSVTGTCPAGSFAGNVYTTGAITGDCEVIAHFREITLTVTPSVGTPAGTITPDTPQLVDYGDTATFTLTPDSGYEIDGVTGTCGGTLTGNSYETAAVVADCTVVAHFRLSLPNIDVSPLAMSSSQAAGTVTNQTLNVGNTGVADLTWTIDEEPAPRPGLANWSDDFDSYATGSQLHGQGGWKGWGNDPAFGALVSAAQSRSTPNSVAVVGTTDLLHEYGETSGQWVFTAWQYVPTTFDGESYFIMLNTYDDAGANNNWSVQVRFDGAANQVVNDGGSSGGTLPLVRGRWVEIRVEIDLDTDTGAFYYDNQQLYSGTWSGQVSGGGAQAIAAVDLFADDSSVVYYDDMSLVDANQPPVCSNPADVPWLSVSPTSGTTAPGVTTPVTVTFDSTGLAAGTYNANLCVTSDDPDPGPGNGTDLVVVPVSLTVTAPVMHTVTSSVGTPSGTIAPPSQSVAHGATATFTLTPDPGYAIDTVGGTCPAGTLAGNLYTTGAITADCQVIAHFRQLTHTVTSSVGTPSGTIVPPSQTVAHGATTTFTLTPDAGFEIDGVGGTCPAGTLAGNVYTTGAITADCEVVANFRPESGPGPSVLEIPTLGPAGGALLGLLLAGLGLGTLRRRRA